MTTAPNARRDAKNSSCSWLSCARRCGYTVRMRLGASVLLALSYALGVGACSGGYPLAPTRCDEFCDATKEFQCEDYYQPAGCVSDCEQNDTDREACRTQFDAAVSCFRTNAKALSSRCNFDFSSTQQFLERPCQTEETALDACTSGYPFPNINE
jgi:hypothetical protein